MKRLLLLLALLVAPAFAPSTFAPTPALAQTASPNLNDQQVLASDPTFQNRVRESLVNYCANVVSVETITGTWTGTMPAFTHKLRVNYCASVLAAPDSFKQLFAIAAAANATIIGDATQGGTVPLTSANVAAQATKVLDGDLNNGVSAVLNPFLVAP